MAIATPARPAVWRGAGRVDITARALERSVTAIASRMLEVPLSDVSVTLVDEAGLLGIRIVAPLRLPSLRDAAASGMHLLDRGQDARTGIRVAAGSQTGRDIGTVSIRFSRAIVSRARRVS
jgi:hypothetical protein